MSSRLDRVDLKMLRLLQNNGRLSNAELAETAGVSADDQLTTMTADDNPQMQDVRNMTPQERRAARQNGGALKANAGNQAMLQGRGLGPAPQLNGIAQILGLALGSPEFQRR